MDKKYKYVLLEEGEIIQEGDEWLDIDDGVHLIWGKTLDAGKEVVSGIYRRRIEATPQEPKALYYLVASQDDLLETVNVTPAYMVEVAENIARDDGKVTYILAVIGKATPKERPVEWTWAGDA